MVFFDSKALQLPAQGKFTLSGWAADRDAKAPAGGVAIFLDDKQYTAQYGRTRTDVVKVLALPALANSGFWLDLMAEDFKAGSHVALLRVLTNDGTGYWESGPITLEFGK